MQKIHDQRADALLVATRFECGKLVKNSNSLDVEQLKPDWSAEAEKITLKYEDDELRCTPIRV